MARDDVFQVRHQNPAALGANNSERASINNFGDLVVVDFYTQLLLSGFCFHMQTGTEDAPSTSNTTIDDTKAMIIADCTSGAMIPLFADVVFATWAAATTIQAMFEADMDKARYSSGGTVFVPEQMNKAATSADAANGSFYTIEGSDLVAAAKSAVPASVELSHAVYSEDALATVTDGMAGGKRALFTTKTQQPVVLTNPGSLLVHFGASADLTAYGSLDFAQFNAGLAW
jgi:hypothetical protein